MFIKISKGLASLIAQNYSTGISEITNSLNSLFDAMYEKKHVVMVDRDSIALLMNCESITIKSKYVMKWIERHYNDLYAITKMLSISIILIEPGRAYLDGNVYYLPVDEYYNFCETQLLTENDDDFLFYLKIYPFINSAQTIYGVCFENNPFYGGNVASRIQCMYNEKKFFLCIVDSDKEYSTARKGSTYKSAKSEIGHHKDMILPWGLYVLNVREKENLFPFNLFIEGCREQSELIRIILDNATEETFRFIKIKDGIKLKHIKETDAHWMEVYGKILADCKRKNVYIDTTDNEEYCIKGINSKALKVVSEPFFEKNNYKTLQQSSMIDKIFAKQIFIIEEWKEIAHKLFDYGCCLSKQVNFLT